MSWLRSKSYSLKVRKGKPDKMETILKGILASDHPDSVKRDLLVKIASQGAGQQSMATVLGVLDLTSHWVLEGDSKLYRTYGLDIFRAWAKGQGSKFDEFFNKEFLLTLFSKKFSHDNRGMVPVLLKESLKALQTSAMFRNHCTVIEAKATGYVREKLHVDCLTKFADLLLEFKECIPKGDLASPFCTQLIRSLSLCGSPDHETEIVNYIKGVNTVANLLAYMWDTPDAQSLQDSLKEIFKIISMPCDVEPSICLGSLVPYIPPSLIPKVVRNVISDSNIDNNSMVTALQRIIDWLLWPTTRFVDTWVIEFLKALASVQKYSVLITVTENKVDQIFQKLQFAPVSEPGLNIVTYMLLSFQHSPDPFHKILPMVPKIVSVWQNDSSDQSNQLLSRLAELLHILMYLHAGFPELYDPVYELIKDFPKPSPDVIKFRLLESKWTAHRDSSAHQPRSYQPKAEMGKTGLFNLGNTCYMNSIIQALYMCDSFRGALLQHMPTPEQSLVVKLQHVFAFLSLSQRPAYAPVNFLATSRPPWFMPGFQQDCSEFLKYLLDQLNEQESSHLKKSIDSPPSPGKHKRDTTGSEKKQKTLIQGNFGGKICTTLKCLNCGTESVKEESFIDLPLAFPEYNVTPGQQSMAGGSSKGCQSSQPYPIVTENVGASEDRNCLHLNDLLKHYLKAEKLTGDNKYYCDNCGGLQEGERKIKIIETPEYLILTLLRFSYDTRLQSRSKVFREVKYPKTLLVPVESESNGQSSSSKWGDPLRSVIASHLDTSVVNSDIDNADMYSLCSVVIHSGTSSDCGHYYCYARHSQVTGLEPTGENQSNTNGPNEDQVDFLQDKWYLFNDSRVSYASYSSFCNVSQRFTKDTAYVLIYRKVNPGAVGSVGMQGSPTKGLDQSIEPSRGETPLRHDLRAAVVKDNKLYLQEQESSAERKASRKRPNDFQWYNWKDDDDRGGTGPCGGGGGLGDLDTSGSRFVF
ncbi:ubiquitin carboxyl-terminal hydrolase 38-like isoform X1 [Mya arenaria]|uniref:ubiquitin carboxyl-terminal hydrolase 38-like isoform X1 n=2 Tax=Mya arenaria TaxID=6604 RepID=UPI0022DEA5BD|nr:ubiquitin carboxyl-terminal hydrolase 38-like isoform X1 [Mya arenaria]